MKTKQLTQVLLLCLALLMPLLAVACKNEPPASGPIDTTGDTMTESEETPEFSVPQDIPMEYENREIYILVRSEFEDEFIATDGGDELSQAVVRRNIAVEDYLDITLKFVSQSCDEQTGYYSNSPFATQVNNAINANDDSFQLVAAYSYFACNDIQKGYYIDLNGVQNGYLNLENDWWNQNYRVVSSLNGQNHFALGDVCSTMINGCEVVFYNESLIGSYLDMTGNQLMQLVYDGGWTLEYLLESIAAVGDSVSTGYWGLTALPNAEVDSFLVGCGLSLVKHEEGETPEINVLDDRNMEIAEALTDLFHNNPAVSFEASAIADFASNQAMFCSGRLSYASTDFSHNEKLSYGILPPPKYEESQAEYYPTSHDSFTVMGVLRTVKEPAVATAVLETLGYYSGLEIRPALYDKTFKYRNLGTPEKATMFDFIVDRIYFDFGCIFSDIIRASEEHYGPIHEFRYHVIGNTSDLTSRLYSYISVYRTNLQKILQDYYS